MCSHRWRGVYEEIRLGGFPLVGWECIDCKEHIHTKELTPVGLGGIVLEKAARLIGPGRTSSGKPYKEQIIDEDGNLTIAE